MVLLHIIKEKKNESVFCKPELTMKNMENAIEFFNECSKIFDNYIVDKLYVSNDFHINMLLAGEADKNDIFIFFNSETGEYSTKMQDLIYKYYSSESRIWPIAMESNPECRRPPEPVSEKQSFDVSSRNDNRSPMKNNMKAIAQIFSRKIIAQTLSPLYRDEVLYFISHKRSDGERITTVRKSSYYRITGIVKGLSVIRY